MATGVGKNKWTNDSEIISNEDFTGDYNYEITYPGKLDRKEILNTISSKSYECIIENDCDDQLYFGDNLDVLRVLHQNPKINGKVKLIYIDPPYGTNSVFQSRSQKNSYKDDLVGSHYIEFLRRRLILMFELLSPDGSLYLHLDHNMVFEAKLILDEVFGTKNYRGCITRKKCSNKNSTKKTYGNISDYILYYTKSDKPVWNRSTIDWPQEKIKKEYPCIDESGRRFKKVPIHAPGVRNGETGKEWKGMLPPEGKHWQYTPKKLDQLDRDGHIYWSSNGNPRRKVYLDESPGIPVQNIWLDVQDSLNQNIKITGYPTEKNPDLLDRIIKASSNEGDIVLDCFAGSGTTLESASKLNRKWIGVDNSSEAIDAILKRFTLGLNIMGDYVKTKEPSKTTRTTAKKPLFKFYCDSQHRTQAENITQKYI